MGNKDLWFDLETYKTTMLKIDHYIRKTVLY